MPNQIKDDTYAQLSAPFSVIMEKPGRGGETFQYVRTVDVIKRLLDVFNLEYTFKIINAQRDGDYVIVHGRLSHVHGGTVYSKDQFGSAIVKYKKGSKEPVDLGNDFKAAASDALKKCATLWGVALDLYEPAALAMTETQRTEILRLLQTLAIPLNPQLESALSEMTAEAADATLSELRRRAAA